MGKLTKKESVLKVYQSGKYSYIYIYYKLGKNAIRINTGNQYVKSYMNTDYTYNSKMPDYARLNFETKRLKNKVDSYIWHIHKNRRKVISQKECLDFVDGKMVIFEEEYKKRADASKPLLSYYEEFYAYKVKELNNRPSVKDYLSLQNALYDFEQHYGRELTFKDIDKTFFIEFRYYLTIPHSKESKTRGNLNDNTINKRISSFKTFMKYIEEERDLFSFKKKLYDFKTDTYENDVVALTKDELKQLNDLKIAEKHWNKLRDIFIFNCFVGLRYADLRKMTSANIIKDDEGDWCIEMETQKGQVQVLIPLQKTPLEILQKYNFELNAPSSQYFNRDIKNLLEKYEMLTEPVEKKRKQIRAVQTNSTPKWKLVSSHTCRRTFITLAIGENVPLNAIMKATGHKKIQTVKKYMQLKTDKKAFKKIDF